MNKHFIIALSTIMTVLAAGCQAQPSIPAQPTQETNQMMLTGQQTEGLEVNTREVSYYNQAKGFFAAPTQPGNYPGIIMIHEWWGLNENIKEMAETLAQEGYMVLAVDLYNGEVAQTAERARELSSSFDQEEGTLNLRAAAQFLREQKAERVASLGWCFGGGQSLQLALSGEELDATVIYYGRLTGNKEELQEIEGPVLGIFGEKDTSISTESVLAFERSLIDLNIENSIHIYPDVGHAFANPSGDNYAQGATEDAWEKTLQFLETNLK